MKKNRQRLATAGLFMALAAVSALPVLAEEDKSQHGWQQEEDGRWFYTNRDGSRETESWVRGADGSRYYLDADGYMAVNQVIKDGDNIYYVNENGVRVRNQWASEPNDDLCDQEVDTLWYYFDHNGRAVNTEGKALKLKDGNAERIYFFDSDGHMLSGWQNITKWNKADETNTYYLGDENQGYARMQWQYLEVDNDFFDADGYEYDSYEFFYFGYDGKMKKNCEDELNDEHFLFDENGALLTGWQPGVTPSDKDLGLNRYYDEETGVRAKGWLFAHDPDNEDSDPHWFYCDDKKGTLFNEGGRDSDDELSYKKINGKTYFFDDKGHMITGLISTDGTAIPDVFMDEGFETLSGDIGKGNGKKAAGIYYLSQDEGTLGQLQSDKRKGLKDNDEMVYYYLGKSGRAYTNTLIKGCIYGPDGAMLHSEDSDKEIFTVDDIYEQDDYSQGRLKDGATPVIPAGSQVIVNKSGKVTQRGTVKVDDVSYDVDHYQAIQKD